MLEPLLFIGQMRVATDPREYRCRANTANVRQSRPESGLDFQVQIHKTFQGENLCARKRGGWGRTRMRVPWAKAATHSETGKKREQMKRFKGLSPESQRQNLAPTVSYMPCSMAGTDPRESAIGNGHAERHGEEVGTHTTVTARFWP